MSNEHTAPDTLGLRSDQLDDWLAAFDEASPPVPKLKPGGLRKPVADTADGGRVRLGAGMMRY